MDMNIKGLDYNTQRSQLTMPEYGREIQSMVEYAVGLPSKRDRQRCANTIIRLMATKSPQQQGGKDFRRKLWDHLYIISDRRLDIDWPFDMDEAEKILAKPEPLPLPDREESPNVRHYGRLVEQLFERLKTMPPSGARDELMRLTANQMKNNLYQWGHGSTSNEKVADDLARFTDGVVQLDLQHFSFAPILNKEPAVQRGGGGKRKKKR